MHGCSRVDTLFLLIGGVTSPHDGGPELRTEGAGKGEGRVALSRLARTSAVNTDDWASTIDFGVFRHRLALLVVLILGVSASTDRTDNRVLRTRATGKLMAKCPATCALCNQGASFVLTGLSGAVPKEEWRVSRDVLKTRTVGIKKSNRNRTMACVRLSGHQPIWFTQQNEVLETSIASELHAESRSRREGGTEQLTHGGDRVQNNAGVTAGWNDRVVRSEDTRERRAETEDVIQGRVAIERQHEVARCLTGPPTAN